MDGHHHHINPEAGDGRVFWSIVVNLALTVAQIAGGLISGSLALIADAIHNLSDALALVIAFFARKIARRPADGQMTFGYGRAEIVAALVNYTTLIVIGLYLIYEATLRFFDPQPVDGWLIVIVAGIALAVDLVTALLTYSLSTRSMNIRAAFLHNVADALGSIAVIFAGTLILLYDWRLIDPLVTLLIAGYILWQSFTEIGSAIRILMLGCPLNIDTQKVLERVQTIEGIDSVHHVHLWQMQENENALDAHLVVCDTQWERVEKIKEEVKTMLHNDFGISHSTLETESETNGCSDADKIGHDSSVRHMDVEKVPSHNH